MVFDTGVPVAAASALGEVPGLDIHVERAVALGIGKRGYAVHLAYESEILEQIGLIDEAPVDAQLLEGDSIVLALAVGALLQLRNEPLLGFFEILNDGAVVALLGFGFIDGGFKLLDLLIHEALERLIGYRQ